MKLNFGRMMGGKGNNRFVLITLSLIVLAGFFIRIDNLSTWLEYKERFFFDNQSTPLMVTVDSYYYLNLARDLQEGTYSDFDARRQVPVGYKQSPTPPLLSVLLARISSISGTGLEWVALMLPAFLGVLLAIPVYLLSNTLTMKARGSFIRDPLLQASSRVAALSAAFVALLSPMFVVRSSIGWCDTDMLNVTFPVLLAYLAIRLADSTCLKEQVAYFCAFALSSLLFLWWWDQSHVPVFALIAIPFAVAIAFVALRSPGRVLPLLLFGAVLLLIVGSWKGFHLLNPFSYLDSLQGMKQYISSETGLSPFRAAGESVSEQSRASFAILSQKSSGSWPAFTLAFCGLCGLAWLSRGYLLFLAPILAVAFLSLRGQRFLIFTAPLFGLGIGTLCFMIFHTFRRPAWRLSLLCLLLTVSCWGAVKMQRVQSPRRAPVLFDAMKAVGDKTEKDAVVWASWGHGHPLLFYGQRGTVADGIFHSARLQYVLNVPLAVDSFRLAANWISFYVVNGPQGLRSANELLGEGAEDWAEGMTTLQQLLAAGVKKSRTILQAKYHLSGEAVEDKLRWLFPGNPRPVHLFLDYLLPSQAWFSLGRWDLKSRSAPQGIILIPLQSVSASDGRKIRGMSGGARMEIDIGEGRLQTPRGASPLDVLKVNDGREMTVKKYDRPSRLQAGIFLPGARGIIADQRAMDTVLVKLFYEYKYDRRFFAPMDTSNPYYALWRVLGEPYRSPDGRKL